MYLGRIAGLSANEAERERSSRLHVIGASACVLISVMVFLINTRHGIGIFVDSTRYMSISERTYDAPVYPWLLQFVTLTGTGLDTAAKLIGLFFVAANTVLVWHLLMRATGSFSCTLAGTLIVILAPQFVTLHSLAMSEPPFLFFLLATLLLFMRYLSTDNRFWLVASAVALGLAALTRFTAPPLGAAIAICLLVDPRRPFGQRLGDAVLFAVVSAAIFFSWTVASQMTSGHSIGRDLWFYGNMGPREWLTSLEALTAWLLPDHVPFSLRVAVFALFFLAAAVLTIVQVRDTLRRARNTRVVEGWLPLILALFFVFYMGFMVLSTSIEANLSLNGRYAFPAYVMTVLLVTILVARVGDAHGLARVLRYGLVALAVFVIGSHAARAAVRSHTAFDTGIGYASLAWRTSPTIAAVRKLPPEAVIYSNGADAIAYLLGRPAHFIPERVQLRTGVDNPDKPYEAQLADLHARLSAGPAYLVLIDRVDWRFYLAGEEELKSRLPLVLVADEADGRIYEIAKPAPSE